MSESRLSHRFELTLLLLVLMLLAWSGVRPHDYPTWGLEVFPAVVGLIVLAATYRRFRLTPLCYGLIAVHMAILIVGGKYTYALVPAGEWLQDLLHTKRNHYDRLGHFAQGFVPAIITREIMVRRGVLRDARWMFFLVLCVCMAISAVYEIVEWAVAAVSKEAADSFLGTQGDGFDTQKDMAMCGVGAVVALLTLRKEHDREMLKMGVKPPDAC